ncbi:permease [Candidatus Desantisbacteria bacterium CG_4_10_14_0_8_um_filter_48_22]|uniref:Permease n=1 Tax=Candidatus Desantisbacteria bacterium CG_4_10_14_0_8_um_filter_48_22 TaxID=1974543 RepID=A0A2M7S5H6_9BACT|nr:MAG: hypothetical protein AUJ67_01500 [Candidatus Desantisbacteria bacterium CG1_02_49_89]PIV57323.1 MAG: permease [Candidatus Desantisbacteria bacterium CG02_land_8_20_14_3_00_49_13]PIZ14628.1 MAG: permease [Candidatus Desantisbacteria bacterium CG_4_10_14_0_8_um_filter_48_22]
MSTRQKKLLGQYCIFFGLAALTLLIYRWQPGKAISIWKTSGNYFFEMLGILPSILILLGLMDAWVPKKIIERLLGKDSGISGIGVAILAGTAAAGPLYVAFPVAASLLKKGARISNVAIFLCSWAAIKIPMVMFEIKFLGWQFTGLRLLLTVPSAIFIGLIMEKALTPKAAH